MKKYIIYVVILLSGLFLGYLIFNNTTGESTAQQHEHSDIVEMWTCSMHPQIMQPEPGDCPICGMDLIPAEASADGLTAGEIKMTENAMLLANIQTSLVGGADQESGKMVLSGKIEVNEDLTATLPAHFDGRIEKLYVNTIGDKVGKGQPVASIYSPDLVAAQQELLTAYKIRESQPQLYSAVKKKFNNWMISDAQVDQIVETGKVMTSLTIYSHVAGVVTEIMVNEGGHIMNGQPIFKVANLNKVWAVFNAYESQIQALKEGQEIEISLNAYPGKNLRTKISYIDPVLDNSSRTLEVRTVLANQDGLLKPGMFIQGELQANTPKNTGGDIGIPKSAVLWTGERSIVYVKTSEELPVFEMREVQLGAASGNSYKVLSGLDPGEEIVTNGTFTVDAAAQLQGKRSMMNNPDDQKKQAMNMKMELPEEFQKKFLKTLEQYFELKEALVNSNPNRAMEAAKNSLKVLPEADLNGMPAQHYKKLKEMFRAISENRELENQRAHFVILSENMIALAANLNDPGNSIYIQHCPMANSNKGADWLSLSEEIRNPYYGEAMLTCGEVSAILNKK